MKRSIPALALSISAVVALSGCAAEAEEWPAPAATGNTELAALLPEPIQDAGVLNVGISPSFYPNAYFPAGSEDLAGVDPDLLEAMGEELGVTINWVTADFPSLVVGVASGKFDIAMSDISDTKERQQQVTFVDYLQSYRMAYVPAENPHDISGDPLTMCGLTAPVQTSTLSGKAVERITEQCVAAGKDPVTTIAVTNHEAVRLAVDSGRADFGVTAGSEGAAFDKEAPGEYKHWPIDGEPWTLTGIATNKDAQELQDALLATLEVLQEDGRYMEILTTYHLKESALETMGINLG